MKEDFPESLNPQPDKFPLCMRVLMLTCHPGIQGPFPKILPLLGSALTSQGCIVGTEPWGRHRDGESILDKVFGRLGDVWRVWRRLRREQFDLLLVHTATEWPNYSRDIPVLWLCRKLVRRTAVQFHGSTPDTVLGPGKTGFKVVSRMLLRLVDAVLVLSSEEQRQWTQFHPSGRFFLVTNPFQPLAAANTQVAPWHFPPQVPVLLYTGRLITPKGVFDLLEALALLKKRAARFHLLVAGTGSEEARFKSRIEMLGLENDITLAGYLDSVKLHQAYRAADLFVFPSWSEGFPTVITEAMDAGLPIVTTYIRGAADHLKEGEHVYFVPPRDPEKLADTIDRLLRDSDLRAQMAQANRLKVKEFAPEIAGARYHDVLKQILDIRSPQKLTAKPEQSTTIGALEKR